MSPTAASPDSPTIAFAGGGTGGHLTPGMAVADALRRLDPHVEVLFLGAGRPIERDLLGRVGYEYIQLPTVSSPRSLTGLLRCAAIGPIGMLAAWRLFAKRRPDVLVALGGYAAFLPAVCASWRGLPVVVLEQNAIPGKVNRWVSRWAVEVVVQWQAAAEKFPHPERVAALGNPVRREALAIDRTTACSRMGLDPNKTTVLVLGGSQGAVAVNELVFSALPRLAELAHKVQILHSAGDVGYADAEARYGAATVTVSHHRFIHDMAAAYGCADVAVCRAGATTLAELTANGIPSILIPYPYASDDHQYANAKLLSDAGAAVVRRQSELSSGQFTSLLVELLADDAKRKAMRDAALSLGLPNAAEVVADRVMRYALERRCLRGAV